MFNCSTAVCRHDTTCCTGCFELCGCGCRGLLRAHVFVEVGSNGGDVTLSGESSVGVLFRDPLVESSSATYRSLNIFLVWELLERLCVDAARWTEAPRAG